MRSHEIDYQILGEDIQVVEVELDPNETVIAEAGAMLYMEDGISFEPKLGDGSQPQQGFLGKIFQAGSRVLTGESLFMTHFSNPFTHQKKSSVCCSLSGHNTSCKLKGDLREYPDSTKRLILMCCFRHKDKHTF